MATPPSYEWSGVVYEATGSQTEYALTSSQGKAIGYLLPEHISVSTSDDDGETWTVLATPADYSFSTQGTRVVLTSAPALGTWVRLKRSTPMDDNWVDYQSGNLLTAGQLNEFESWQLYIDQELADQVSNVDGSAEGSAVKEITGTEPIQVDNTDKQTPVVSIEETVSTDNPNALTSDTDVMSEKAIDLAFSLDIGDGTSYPPAGVTAKTGKLRINPATAIPGFFYWNGSAWVEVSTKGEPGDQGPPGPAPGLQDPPATAVTVPLNEDGTLGAPTADVVQDPSTKDLKFLFGIPAGEKGDKGDTGADSQVPGPPPGLQGNAAVANNVATNPDGSVGQATASVSADASGDLQFTFGIPQGIQGPVGPPGEGVDYKGMVDATSDAEPSIKANGDFYVNTGTGTSSWTGLTNVTQNDRLIWNANTNVWDRLTPPPVTGVDLSYVAAAGQGTVSNSAGTNAVLPAVDSTNAGLMTPAEYTKLNGIEAGAQVNQDLSTYLQSGDNVSELNNDAGYITAADVPTPPTPTLQSVLDEGNTSITDLWIGNDGEIVKLLNTGALDASTDVKAGGNVEATGDVKAAAFRIDLLATLP